MVGRDLVLPSRHEKGPRQPLLETRGLSGERFENVDLVVNRGEIVGLAGLVGAGRSEVAKTIIGALPKKGGEVHIDQEEGSITHPVEAYTLGVGYLPEDRKHDGLFLDMTVEENILSSYLQGSPLSRSRRDTLQKVKDLVKLFNISPPDVRQKAVNLSGGNQQKILLSRCLLTDPRLLLVDEPTHGVDVGAKAEIYRALKDLVQQGIGILLISSELPEIIALSDRIYVMWNGVITAELDHEKDEITEENILHYASGTKNMFLSAS